MKKFILILLSLLMLTSCAQLQQAAIEQSCNTNAAYASGMNDAKNQQDMRTDYASICPDQKAAINRAYRRGYKFGLKQRSKEVVVNVNNTRAWGIKKECVEHFGKKVCGYHCKTAMGNTRCAMYASDNCVSNNFEVTCGRNCRIDSFNKAHCKIVRYSSS